MYHVSSRFLKKKKKNLPLKFGYFHFSVSSSTFLTALWLPFFVSAEPGRTILWIDRSEPRFKSHTGSKITETWKKLENLKKRWKFWRFLLIFTYIRSKKFSDRSRKWKIRHSAFNWKKNYFRQTFTDDARMKNVTPPLYLARILKPCHKRNDGRKFPEK